MKLQDDGKDKDGKDKRPGSSSKLAEKAKKKAWYSVLYPSYKSRAEDFKKLFKDVPDDERLVVGESLSVVNKTFRYQNHNATIQSQCQVF